MEGFVIKMSVIFDISNLEFDKWKQIMFRNVSTKYGHIAMKTTTQNKVIDKTYYMMGCKHGLSSLNLSQTINFYWKDKLIK